MILSEIDHGVVLHLSKITFTTTYPEKKKMAKKPPTNAEPKIGQKTN